MARKGAQENRFKRFYVSVYAKKDEKPYFLLARKEPQGYVLNPKEVMSEKGYVEYPEYGLSGDLVKAEVTGFTNPATNEWVDVIKVTLRDYQEAEDYVISVRMSQVGRSMINQLLNLCPGAIGQIEMSIYTNKGGYNSISVRNDGEWTGVKYNNDHFKQYIRSYEGKGGKTEYDCTKLDEFIKDQVSTILIPMVKEHAKKLEAFHVGTKDYQPEEKPQAKEVIPGPQDRDVSHMIPNEDSKHEINFDEPTNDLPF